MGAAVSYLMGKKQGKKAAPTPAVAPEPEAEIAPVEGTREQRAAAATMRSRRGGRRALLSGGRLGGGTEGGQTTLGAG